MIKAIQYLSQIQQLQILRSVVVQIVFHDDSTNSFCTGWTVLPSRKNCTQFVSNLREANRNGFTNMIQINECTLFPHDATIE